MLGNQAKVSVDLVIFNSWFLVCRIKGGRVKSSRFGILFPLCPDELCDPEQVTWVLWALLCSL